MTSSQTFSAFFRLAAGQPPDQGPFPYQERLANAETWPARIEIPTGLGKTLAVVIAWLWRRREESPLRATTPRRLIYCLPMRVLVEQTRDIVQSVLERLGQPARVAVLMGGVEDSGDWDTHPEEDLILIGTQDMLLSRALNRGYGMSRYRWPLHFGLLNNDCLWVIDEVQLVGSGVATTAQLQALRRKLGTVLPTRTSWMSATLEESWLRTVDVEPVDLKGAPLALEEADREHPVVKQRIGARKLLSAASSKVGDLKGLAKEIVAAHRRGTRTLAIVNTVERARELFLALEKERSDAALVLLHSRFRPAERAAALEAAVRDPQEAGTIVVSTQVIEAGVDLTSTTLFTEVAPWASLVQRFGRCNRRGEDEAARVLWVGLPDSEKERLKLAKPYAPDDLLAATGTLIELSEVGPAALPKRKLELEQGLVLRRGDLLDLFDTTPDLSGNDVDVSRFIRDTDDHDVRVCWRDFDDEPDKDSSSPSREELCAVPMGVINDWKKRSRPMWRWDSLRGRWTPVESVFPGLTVLLRAQDGGYDPRLGVDPKGTQRVPPVLVAASEHLEDDRYEGEPQSEWNEWYTLRQHSEDVANEARNLVESVGLPPPYRDVLTTAGRWHDAGKAHKTWQAAATRVGTDPPHEPVAKSKTQKGRLTFERPGFRHELASALLALHHGQSDLICYLIACHHGKVRVSIRSLPTEKPPTRDGHEEPAQRYARGVWDGDPMPEVDLGAGLVVPPTALTLAYMELGDDPETGPSWISRVLALRDDPELGPFRLGFLEALIKCADERASRRARAEVAR